MLLFEATQNYNEMYFRESRNPRVEIIRFGDLVWGHICPLATLSISPAHKSARSFQDHDKPISHPNHDQLHYQCISDIHPYLPICLVLIVLFIQWF